jgi:predicted DNA-binding transcriptional regulator
MIEMQVETKAVQSRWGLALGEDQQSPVIVRYLQVSVPNKTRRTFGDLMSIQWNYEVLRTNGMPTRDQSHEMDIFEGAVLKRIEHSGKGILTAVVTQDGSREWMLYVSEPEDVHKLVEELISKVEGNPVTIEVSPDTKWKGLSELTGSFGG